MQDFNISSEQKETGLAIKNIIIIKFISYSRPHTHKTHVYTHTHNIHTCYPFAFFFINLFI